MRNDFLFFVGIIVLIFSVWVASGGPDRPNAFVGPYLHPITNTATTAQAYGSGSTYQPINTSWWDGNSTQQPIASADASPYRSIVSLSRDTRGAIQTSAKSEYITVNVSLQGTEPISTTGWKLVSKEHGTSALFPVGSEIPSSGRVNTLSAIMLRPGDQAIVTTGRSPVGASFRENSCTGYLEEHQDFSPSLGLYCPIPSEEYEGNDDECLNAIRGLPRCVSDVSLSNNAPASCEEFVQEELNYNSCVARHRQDDSFMESTWRIYLGHGSELWERERETILLLDANGKTIDSLSY